MLPGTEYFKSIWERERGGKECANFAKKMYRSPVESVYIIYKYCNADVRPVADRDTLSETRCHGHGCGKNVVFHFMLNAPAKLTCGARGPLRKVSFRNDKVICRLGAIHGWKRTLLVLMKRIMHVCAWGFVSTPPAINVLFHIRILQTFTLGGRNRSGQVVGQSDVQRCGLDVLLESLAGDHHGYATLSNDVIRHAAQQGAFDGTAAAGT